MKLKKTKIAILSAVVSFCSGTAQSAELPVGCAYKTYGTLGYIAFSGSVSKVDGKDFGNEGQATVEVQMSGNEKEWKVDAPVDYKKIGDRIEFTGNHQLPASAEEIKGRFGSFLETKCVTK